MPLNEKQSGMTIKKKKMLFSLLILALPILQFLVFYVFVNFNQIIISFQKFDNLTKKYVFMENPLENYKTAFYNLVNDPKLIASFKNSTIVCIATLTLGVVFALVCSSYISHKRFGYGVFRIMLFLPQIVSIMTLVSIFKFINERAIPEIVKLFTGKTINNLLNMPNQTRTTVILLFSVLIATGMQVLTYSGTMSGISESVIEACQLDGCNRVQEFFHVTVPMIWPTVITFVTVTLSAYFLNQMNMFSFFGKSASPQDYTYGYYLYSLAQEGTETGDYGQYPLISAMGIIFTCIIAPIVIGVRRLMTQFGPSVD